MHRIDEQLIERLERVEQYVAHYIYIGVVMVVGGPFPAHTEQHRIDECREESVACIGIYVVALFIFTDHKGAENEKDEYGDYGKNPEIHDGKTIMGLWLGQIMLKLVIILQLMNLMRKMMKFKIIYYI